MEQNAEDAKPPTRKDSHLELSTLGLIRISTLLALEELQGRNAQRNPPDKESKTGPAERSRKDPEGLCYK